MSDSKIALRRGFDKWSSSPWLHAIPLLLVQMASGMREMPQFAFFLIYLQEQFHLTPVAISSLASSAQVAGMTAALFGGAITARLGRKWLLVSGLALSGLGSLVFQLPLLGVVAVLWILGGAGGALTSVGGASFLTRIGARGALGVLAAFYALSMTIGGAVGNPIAALIIERSSFAAFSWFLLALSAGAISVVVIFMPSANDQAAQIASVRSFWTGIQSTIRQPKIRLLVGMRCLPTIFYGMLTVLIPLLINSMTGSKVLVAAFGTTSLVVASAAQLLAGRAADRGGARLPTLTAYATIICVGLGLALTSGTLWGLFVFGVLGNAAAWSLSTMMYVWVNDGIPKTEHPATFGLLHAVWSLSMISGSVLGGWFVSTMPGLPFLIAGLSNIGAFILIRSFYGRKAVGL